MGELYGINASTYRQLGAEDRASVRQAAEHSQPPTSDMPETPAAQTDGRAPRTPSAADVETAATPQAAVAAVHGLPVPGNGDLGGMPQQVQASVYAERVRAFNNTRVSAASEALARFQPQASDYAALPRATAQAELAMAQSDYGTNPYIAELERIVQEGSTAPDTVPAYLTGSDATAITAQLPLGKARDALAVFGVALPENATPAEVQAGYDLLSMLPDDVLGWAINPGSQVTFDMPVAGVGTPGLPVRAGADVTVTGQVELSDVRTGVDFAQSQQFEMSVQTQGGAHVALGKTVLNRLYGLATRFENHQLPANVQQLVNNSPMLRNVLKGLPIPVSGSYEQYQGARLSYRATVTPEQGAALAAGNLDAAPNPMAPLDMPIGTSAMFLGQTLQGSAFEANYKLFRIGGTQTDLDGQGFGVTRVDANIVEVYSGPVQTVEETAFMGLGKGSLSAGMSTSSTQETQQMQVSRIDLRTEEGRAAYQTFMSAGQVPAWSPPGVVQAGTMTVSTLDYARSVGVTIGPLEWQQALESNNGTLTWTSWSDGTTDVHNNYSSDSYYNDARRTADLSTVASPDGVIDPQATTYRLVLSDWEGPMSTQIDLAFDLDGGQVGDNGAYVNFDGDQHVQMTFTAAELTGLRDLAVQYMANERPHRMDEIAAGAWNLDTIEQIATAQTPDAVFSVLYNADTNVPSALLSIARGTDIPVPGAVRIAAAG